MACQNILKDVLNSRKHNNKELQDVLKFYGRKHSGVTKSKMAKEITKGPLTNTKSSNNVLEMKKFIRLVFLKSLKG